MHKNYLIPLVIIIVGTMGLLLISNEPITGELTKKPGLCAHVYRGPGQTCLPVRKTGETTKVYRPYRQKFCCVDPETSHFMIIEEWVKEQTGLIDPKYKNAGSEAPCPDGYDVVTSVETGGHVLTCAQWGAYATVHRQRYAEWEKNYERYVEECKNEKGRLVIVNDFRVGICKPSCPPKRKVICDKPCTLKICNKPVSPDLQKLLQIDKNIPVEPEYERLKRCPELKQEDLEKAIKKCGTPVETRPDKKTGCGTHRCWSGIN